MVMNRNEKFEWKKQIVRDMAKKGAKVREMAKRLEMGEEEMYAFLSRNFGGVRKLRESMGLPRDIKRKQFATAAEEPKEPRLVKVTSKKGESLTDFMENQKQKMLEDFKYNLSKDMQKVFEETKADMLEDFKKELIEELNTF